MKLRLRHLAIGLMLATLVPASAAAFAQDATATVEPTPEATQFLAEPEAVVVGDANSESLQVVRDYIEGGNTDVIAEDVTFFDRTLPEPMTGRDPFLNSQTAFHGGAFTDFLFTPMRYIVADNIVVVEFDFVGTPSLSMPPVEPIPSPVPIEEATPDVLAADVPAEVTPAPVGMAPGGDIRVPMLAIYEVNNGQITHIDTYYDAAAMQYQLGYSPYTDPYYAPYYGVPGATAAGTDLAGVVGISVGEIIDNLDQYSGQRVIVQGNVGAALDDRAFMLMNNNLFGSDQDLLVIDATEDGLQFVQLANTEVLVAGVVQTFARADLEQQYGWTLDEGVYGPYEGAPVLLAERAVNLNDVATIGNIVDDPAAFYGQKVSVSGDVDEAVGEHAFLLGEGGLLNFTPRQVLVIYVPMLPVIDSNVVVTGTVREFSRADVESELGITLDEGLFGPYENQPVIVAESVYDWNQ